MGDKDLANSELLEVVFKEVENTDDLPPQKSKTTGFLEDIFNLEKETLLGKNKRNENKKNTKPTDYLKTLQEMKSLIHEGLTDSSDDEDNKYFEENKYNDCGKNLKLLLKQKTSSQEQTTVEPAKNDGSWKNAQIAREKLKMQLDKLKNNESRSDLIVDPILGMRIVNPLISSTKLKEKMIGRIAIGTLKIKKFVESSDSKNIDWVTGGVVVSKQNRTSQKGNQYCIWNITDLSGDIKMVCVFLFGSAYKEYWKTALGTVVGILNPTLMESRDKLAATLRVDNSQKILLIGTSKDYGTCKSRKKNGENCSTVVNTAKCEFCVYHIKKEYVKACRRSDLQPPKIGRSLDNLKAKVLGKNHVFYGGKMFTGTIKPKKSALSKKDEDRLKYLSHKNIKTSNAESQISAKDKSILSKLNKNDDQPETKRPSVICQQKLIDLDFTITKEDISAAKAKAIKFIQQNGPLKKVTEEKKAKKTINEISALKRKLNAEEEGNVKNKKIKAGTIESDPIKDKLEKCGITEEFFKVMNSEMRDNSLLQMAETEEIKTYFNKLEMRETIENKMAATFKVDCKAVRCLQCNYKSFSASELCKKEKHPLKIVNAVKRFWKCGNCSTRTVCLELVPLNSCKTCGSAKWERASMLAEKKGPNLTVEPLSLRGHEEKFLGATIKNANLNLLVPDENS